MIPRTVLMAQEVAAQFTPTQIDDYGNIILNGYLSVVPNTINKKAWQYQETLTAPVNLPSLSEVRPALRGWTTNYMEYYTQLPPNAYGVNPGDPTMFSYSVHSQVPDVPAVNNFIASLGAPVPGSNYVPGLYYDLSLLGGSGYGAIGTVTVDGTGAVSGITLKDGGQGYTAGDNLTAYIPGGSGWSVTVASVNSTPYVSNGQPRWAQPPRRFYQNQVAPFVPPNANQEAIQYSFMYPVADNPTPPPIDIL
jgi:hypothetical protein